MGDVARVRFAMTPVKAEALEFEFVAHGKLAMGRDNDDGQPAGDNSRLLQHPSPRPVKD